MKVLLTCPPMIGQLSQLQDVLSKNNIDISVPNFTGLMSEEELCKIIGNYDGWIIGDDPCTDNVIKAGVKGKLKVLVK